MNELYIPLIYRIRPSFENLEQEFRLCSRILFGKKKQKQAFIDIHPSKGTKKDFDRKNEKAQSLKAPQIRQKFQAAEQEFFSD